MEKTRPAETSPEWGEEEIKENGGGGEFKYDTFVRTLKMPQYTLTKHSSKKLLKKTFTIHIG
jgi:hypothetical protein